MGKVYIGTSGWVYSDWQGKFYPPDLPQRKWLEFYSQNFKTVEVNATFYHQMKPATFENWAKTVPDDFIFAVKASLFITHIKRLRNVGSSIIQIIEPATVMDSKLGPILFQCPPRFGADGKRLEAFLQAFTSEEPIGAPRRWPKGLLRGENISLAFEFRDPSWFSEPIYKILRKYNVALVIAESGGHPTSPRELRGARWPCEEVITADFTYLRFHGEGGSYASKYTDNELKEWAKKIKKWQKAGIDVYVYFNNDVGAFAVQNAKSLINLVR